jgi:cell division protein FtsI (penicillin-binding protein 3)
MSRRTAAHRPAPAGSIAARRRVLLGVWILTGGLLLARAAELQVASAHEWRAEADRQHRMQSQVDAPRGTIQDRSGVALALTHETFRVAVAPGEVRDADEAARLLVEALEIPTQNALRAVRSERKWVSLPGHYPPSVRRGLTGVRGVYVTRELRRFYPRDELVRGILGGVVDGRGAGGVEQAFDAHLVGTPGIEVMARNPEGRPIPGEAWVVDAPRSGGSMTLTLDVDLQEIGYEALSSAIEATDARGGDLLVTDPRTGEILALVSLRDGRPNHLAALNTPFEPGSTLKPFTTAALLRLDRATLADTLDTSGGRGEFHGRILRDVHILERPTLAEALQGSSNVAIARAAEALAPDEHYEALRDFGFGVATGVDLPGEAAGTLRRPRDWSRQSSASLAIGYEIAVTPLQLAMAYGALANGGVLMEPRIVRELRDEQGRVLRTFEPRAVRRVIPEEVALEINRALVGAVDGGTGSQARLASFSVAGKSGTSRAYLASGGYETGAYYASFAGFFPAEDPQLVVFVRLDRPQGAYFGGATAAPVTRATMEAVLAARKPPLDRRALASIARAQRPQGPAPAVLFASLEPDLPAPAATASLGPLGEAELILPDLRGLSPRVAARRLHAMGLTVAWEGAGEIRSSWPAPGQVVVPGDTIRLVSGAGGRAPPGVPARRGDE